MYVYIGIDEESDSEDDEGGVNMGGPTTGGEIFLEIFLDL
jgi:hypothetical protein